jgi:ubiquinone/menaquinone biosynthesis C-methylase UbiE
VRTSAAAGSDRGAYEVWHVAIPADGEQESPWHRLIRRRLDLTGEVANRRLLEVACGRGSFARWLVQQPQRPALLVAADFSETAVRKARAAARQAGLPAVTWQIADILALPFRDDAFDTVVSCETIEHVPDPPRAVRELARVLRPGGRLLLTTPNYVGLMGLYRGYLRLTGRRYTETGQPINRFTMLPVTRSWVRRAGLSVEAVDSDGYYVPVPGRPPVELRAVGRPRFVMRWLGLHSLVVGRKPHPRAVQAS